MIIKNTLIRWLPAMVMLLIASLEIKAQNILRNGTIFLVRHAEKEKGNDPVLSVKGKERSGDLSTYFNKHPPDIIYVSQYRRSMMTADSIRIKLKVDTLHFFSEDSGDSLMKKINPLYERILVIAHSNTIPAILKKIGITTVTEIPDEQYDDLFIIRFRNGKVRMKRIKYGQNLSCPKPSQQKCYYNKIPFKKK